ncbi:Uu.00g010820.m01.CDS01 [Anthostomella pinea]|uniref:Uu.00g010820.m01.CDS01 n=1 Tax=Anthostomella pinea TaxID=933095 RepID=A0AAI8YQ14_9PEZI|nr:Uu.00g010820.m01.CDS01 [Anthostomella pinea]
MVLLSDSSEISSPDESESENDFDDTGIADAEADTEADAEADAEAEAEAEADETPLPPSKRQKLGDGSRASSSVHVEPEPEPEQESEHDLDGDISSDTSGDVPNSPINAKLDEDEFQEQVTVCAWDGCKAGDLGNMDRLVEHIHNDHIENRQKKYTCEWNGCPRKSLPHASGYALKAHMRSHTREKPFYCYLPECDRAFTRSDALAKHMRTVHETEALRPSDPVPKSMQYHAGEKRGNKLKIIIKTPQSHAAGQDDAVDDGEPSEDVAADFFTPLTEQQGFTSRELAMDMKSLLRLCRAQVKWGTAEGDNLRQECMEAEEAYRQEWLEKEVLLDQVAQVEDDWWQRREAVLAAEASSRIPLKGEAEDFVRNDHDAMDVAEASENGEPARPSQTTFTQSGKVGRHLDRYIKEKNPKPPDGVHDVEAIRKMRATRRRGPRAHPSPSPPPTQVARSNSTVNVFLGGRKPPWLTSAKPTSPCLVLRNLCNHMYLHELHHPPSGEMGPLSWGPDLSTL